MDMARRLYAFLTSSRALIIFMCLGVACAILAQLWFPLGKHHTLSDYWIHRGALLALLDSPFNPSNPLLTSYFGARSFVPLFIGLAYIGQVWHIDAATLLHVAGAVTMIGFVICGFLLGRGLGMAAPALMVCVLLFAWGLPINFPGFHNLRSAFSNFAYPSAHALVLGFWAWYLVLRMPHWGRRQYWTGAILLIILLGLIVVTHQFSALFILGGCIAFCFLDLNNIFLRVGVVTIASVAAVSAAFFWPYFDLLAFFSSAADSAWEGPDEFFQPLFVVLYAGVSLAALLSMTQRDTIVRYWVFWGCALALFAAYMLTYFLAIEAGGRLLPYWILFLQIIFALEMDRHLRSDGAAYIKYVMPVFLAAGGLQVLAGVIDTSRPYLPAKTPTSVGREIRDYERYGREIVAQLSVDSGSRGVALVRGGLSFPVQGLGARVVSISANTPDILDMRERQLATEMFFQPTTGNADRWGIAKKYNVTHVIFRLREVREEDRANIFAMGQVRVLDNFIAIVRLKARRPQ